MSSSFSVNVMTRGPGEHLAAMLSLFRGVADEILVALDDRAGPEVEEPLVAVADRVIRYPYADPVDRPLAWLHAECRGDWVLTIDDDDEVPMQSLLDPEEEPVVVSVRPDLPHEFAGRIVPRLEDAGAERVVVPEELVREGHRRPLLDLVATAKKLGIPVHASSGEELSRSSVARRRLR